MTTTSLYEKQFMLTGENIDPTPLDFTFYTQRKVINDPADRPIIKEYYMSYDSQAGIFSDLAVKRSFEYTLQDGEVIRRDETTEWFYTDGSVGITKTFVVVYQ